MASYSDQITTLFTCSVALSIQWSVWSGTKTRTPFQNCYFSPRPGSFLWTTQKKGLNRFFELLPLLWAAWHSLRESRELRNADEILHLSSWWRACFSSLFSSHIFCLFSTLVLLVLSQGTGTECDLFAVLLLGPGLQGVLCLAMRSEAALGLLSWLNKQGCLCGIRECALFPPLKLTCCCWLGRQTALLPGFKQSLNETVSLLSSWATGRG